ncbi:MAG: MFS transporter, partial [Anaerolineae bacterium]|nr:MFS transporter [Anaerolineae bacterium]
IMLGLGFIAIRMFGQGSLTLVSQNIINQWWVRRRGMVMGISGILVGLFGLGLFPRIVNDLIPVYGWQNTYIMLGLSLFMLMVPTGLLFFHNRPEDYGLQPDGGLVKPGQDDNPGPVIEENWSLQEANRTPVYWALALGMGSTSMLSTGLFFHMVSIFDDNGLSTTVAASAFLPIAITSGLVNLSGGILIDRIPPRFLLAGALFSQTGALILAQHLTGVTSAFIYGIILGTSMGLIGTVNGVVWAKYFGRQHLGSITGMTTSILIIGAAIGPLPLGFARDLLGSYNLALTVGAILPLVLGLVNLFFDQPRKYSTT